MVCLLLGNSPACRTRIRPCPRARRSCPSGGLPPSQVSGCWQRLASCCQVAGAASDYASSWQVYPPPSPPPHPGPRNIGIPRRVVSPRTRARPKMVITKVAMKVIHDIALASRPRWRTSRWPEAAGPPLARRKAPLQHGSHKGCGTSVSVA